MASLLHILILENSPQSFIKIRDPNSSVYPVSKKTLTTGAASFAEAMRMGADVYRVLELKLLEIQEAKPPLPVTSEGGFAPELEDDREAFTTVDEAIKDAGYEGKVKIAVDIGATAFCRDG